MLIEPTPFGNLLYRMTSVLTVFFLSGMMYNEITASSLVKVNMQGEVEEEGTTNFGVNQVRRTILKWILVKTEQGNCPPSMFCWLLSLCIPGASFIFHSIGRQIQLGYDEGIEKGLKREKLFKKCFHLTCLSFCKIRSTKKSKYFLGKSILPQLLFRRVSFCILLWTKK